MNRGLMVFAGVMSRMTSLPRLKFVSAEDEEIVTYIDLANVCRLDFEPAKQQNGLSHLTVFSNTINPSSMTLTRECAAKVREEYENRNIHVSDDFKQRMKDAKSKLT